MQPRAEPASIRLVVDYGDATVRISMTVPNANPAGGHNGTIGGSGRRTDYNSIEAFIVTTGSGSDTLVTGGGNDRLRPGTGTDAVAAGAGDDLILFGAALTAADSINGGAGIDTLVLQGDYAGSADPGNERRRDRDYHNPRRQRYEPRRTRHQPLRLCAEEQRLRISRRGFRPGSTARLCSTERISLSTAAPRQTPASSSPAAKAATS